jgi:methyl-accepting chemotaxis protein
MTIRKKIIALLLCSIIVLVAGISLTVFSSARQAAVDTFRILADSQLERVEERITTFMEPGMMSVAYLAGLPLVQESRGKLTSYLDTTQTTTLRYADHPPYERLLYDEFIRVANANANYGLVFMANDDGQYAQAPEGQVKSAGYDPRKRSWYVEAMASSKKIFVSSPYQTTGGGMVCSILTRTFDPRGRPLGLLGVDYSLESLTRDLDGRRILERGYLVIFDAKGRIVADGRYPENVGKKPEDYPELRKRMASAPDGALEGADADGVDSLTYIRSIESLNWKAAIVIAREVEQSMARSLIRNIVLVSVILGLALLLLGVILASGITRPLTMLVEELSRVQEGRFDTLACPQAGAGNPEISALRSALANMVSRIQELVSSSAAKAREAEEQSRKAGDALIEAETARKEAEKATRLGRLGAAEQLESIVGKAMRSTRLLSEQISQADKGAAVQLTGMEKAFSIVSRMNAAVSSVAEDAAMTGEKAGETREKADAGRGVVKDVVAAIGKVSADAAALTETLNALGAHAEGIGQLMTIITDIADQTNLLALNAAIEAARAGDAGRGFAVVADEVRKLAEKTMTATKEVGNAVTAIQKGTQDSIASMSNSSEAIRQSTDLAGKAGEALQSILGVAESTAGQVRAIAESAEMQAKAGDQLNESTAGVERIARETADRMNDAKQAVAGISSLVEEIQRVVETLKQ